MANFKLHGDEVLQAGINRTIVKVHGKDIWQGGSNRTLAAVSDARRMIDGAGSIEEMAVVALWWTLTHKR